MVMTSSVIKVIRGLVTGFLILSFMMAGILKLTDQVSSETQDQLRKEFVRYAKVHPAVMFGYRIDPEKYMKQIGIIELAGATFLLFGPRLLKMLSCLVLSSVMMGAMYSLFQLKEPMSKIAVPAAILLLLFLKLNFLLMGSPRKEEKRNVKTVKVD